MLTATSRLSPRQFRTMCEALRAHGVSLRHARDHDSLRVLTLFVKTLPTCAPYSVTITAREWPIISRALRPQGMKPTPGSDAARYLALYQWMILPQNFYGLRVLSPRTQREHAKRTASVINPH